MFKKGYSTKKEDGHGFGLMIVSETLCNNNGAVEVESDENETLFTISINKAKA